MNYLIHNGSRARSNRTVRAANATHRGMKQYLFKEQLRLVRGRPLLLTEDKFIANLDEIRAKAKAGLLYVTTQDLTPFDVETLSVVAAKIVEKKEDFPLDSINRDQPSGIEMNKFGDKPPPAHFEMPVDLPDAAFDEPPLPPPVSEPSEPAASSPAADQSNRDQNKNKHKRR